MSCMSASLIAPASTALPPDQHTSAALLLWCADIQMYPAVAGAVVPIYNLANRLSTHPDLILTPSMVSKIFGADLVTGSITTWNDPSIVALNPELDALGLLTAAPIQVVVREDKSGTTEIFTKGLAKFDTSFASISGMPTDKSTRWSSTVTKADTNGGVAATVFSTPNSIGYSVLAEADALGLPKAKLKVASSDTPGVATADSVELAVVEKGTLFGNNGQPASTLTADLQGTVGPLAWPIAGYTYLIMRKDTTHFFAGQTCESRYEVTPIHSHDHW